MQAIKTGRAKGGYRAAEILTAEERQERARKGALARWREKPLAAIRKGNFKEDFGIDIDCYVLDDVKKTAVISQRGMAAAIGLTNSGGQSFIRFANSKNITLSAGAEFRQKIENPLKFQWGSGGAEQPPSVINGYDVTLLIDICKAIVKADEDGRLRDNQKHTVKQAHVILNASAKLGIQHLVYALTGYRPETEEVIRAFKAFVQNEVRKYEKEFPEELYSAWHSLYQIPVPLRGKPWLFRHLTRRHVYYPLAKSSGKILDLLQALRDKDPKRRKLFQFLSDIGTRALRMHLGRVLEMAESSKSKEEYESRITERFGGQIEMDFQDQ